MRETTIEICLVISNEMANEIQEKIEKEFLKYNYKLNQFSSIKDFLTWYQKHESEVCLITNEYFKSESFKSLKQLFPDLKTFILTELQAEAPTSVTGVVYTDSKKKGVDISGLMIGVKKAVEDLKLRAKKNKELQSKVNPPLNSNMDNKGEVNKETLNDNVNSSDIENSSDSINETSNDVPPSIEKLPVADNNGEIMNNRNEESQSDPIHENEGEVVSDSTSDIEQNFNINLEKDKNTNSQEKNNDEKQLVEAKTEYQNKEFPIQLRKIQKSLSGPKMDKKKTIGVWSPFAMMGVTSFCMNFSFFLSENKVHTAVLENLTTNHILKDWLKRYTPIPEKWVSLASHLHAAELIGTSEWQYRGVKFFPLSKDDIKQKWSADSFDAYYRLMEIYDVTLIDMPSGEMEVYTKESLMYMDELWIIVDDKVQQLNSWKDYIKQIEDKHEISIYLIHNKIIDASRPDIISDNMSLTMLSTIPTLGDETAKNYYQTKPLYLQKEVQDKLLPPYHQLATHLIGPSFQLQEKKLTLWEQIVKRGKFQNILNG